MTSFLTYLFGMEY